MITTFCIGCAPGYKELGYSSQSDYLFSKTLGNPTPDRIEALKGFGVTDRQTLDSVIKEMDSINYSANNQSYQSIFNYLEDRRIAKIKGVGILAQRDSRIASESLILKRKQEESMAQKRQHANEFPYTAYVSCNFNGVPTTLPPCFLAKNQVLSTQLELRNGKEYYMYQPWEIDKLGQSGEEGVVIPLRNKFTLTVQNANDVFILTVVVKNTLTNEVLVKKSAALWEYIKVVN